MKMPRFLSGFLLVGSCAMAQAAVDVEGAAERQVPHAQRRAELRQALQPQRQLAETASRPIPRQLSPQERQALRQQLRQQPQQGAGRSAP